MVHERKFVMNSFQLDYLKSDYSDATKISKYIHSLTKLKIKSLNPFMKKIYKNYWYISNMYMNKLILIIIKIITIESEGDRRKTNCNYGIR